MHVITRQRLLEFAVGHPEAAEPLDVWYRIVKASGFQNPEDLRRTFGTASFLGEGLTVFHIGGNKFRLVVRMRYDLQRAYIARVMTHGEYDQWSPVD